MGAYVIGGGGEKYYPNYAGKHDSSFDVERSVRGSPEVRLLILQIIF